MKTRTIQKQNHHQNRPDSGRRHHGRQIEPEIVVLLGLPFHRIDEKAALSECERVLNQDEPKHIVTPNADFVSKAWKSPELKRIIVGAHRVLCDGQPIVWMSKLLGRNLPGRVTGSDLTPGLLKIAAKRGDGVFIFGTDEKTLGTLREKLKVQFPGLNLVGSVSPPYGPIETWENENYVEQIRNSGAKLLLVCLGFPKQDVWIDRYLKKIETVSLAIGIGASLDFIAGKQIRAPWIFRAVGMEWSWRLIQDPRRMVGRYTDNFFCLLTIGARQIKGLYLRGKESGRQLRFLNGVDLEGSLVIEPSQAASIESRYDAVFTKSVVMDCRNETCVSTDLVRNVITMLRFCWRRKLRGCLFNAPESLVRHLEEMQYSRWIPSFRHPAAVQAWVTAVRHDDSREVISLRVPNRLDHEAFAREFLKDIAELLKHAPGGISHFRLDLKSVSNLNVPASVRLAGLRRKLRSGELGEAPALVSLANARPEVADFLDIIGMAEEYDEAILHHDVNAPQPSGNRRGGIRSQNLPVTGVRIDETDSSDVALPS